VKLPDYTTVWCKIGGLGMKLEGVNVKEITAKTSSYNPFM
jgi:hypothetical protein